MRLNNLLVITILMLKRFWNDKVFLCIFVLSPILICINYGYVAYEEPTNLKTSLIIDQYEGTYWNDDLLQIARLIEDYRTEDGTKPFVVDIGLSSPGKALNLLDESKTKAVLWLNQDNDVAIINVMIDCTEPAVVAQYKQEMLVIIEQYSDKLSAKLLADHYTKTSENTSDIAGVKKVSMPPKISFETNAWKDLVFFDFHASGVIVLIALGMPLFLSAISITYDHTMHTLERLFASPYNKSEVIVGKLLCNSILSFIITIIIIITLKMFFNITLGNITLLLMLSTLVAVNGVIFGLLISSVTRKVVQSLVTAMLSLLFYMIIMTYLWPQEVMHDSLKLLSLLVPYTYGLEAVRQVNLTGAGFAEVWPSIILLIFFIFVQALLAIKLLRRQIH